jgi:hypothetical protein
MDQTKRLQRFYLLYRLVHQYETFLTLIHLLAGPMIADLSLSVSSLSLY